MTTPALPTDAELVTGQPIRSDHVKALRDRKANLDSPAFTGTPTAPTAAAGTNTTQLATTAFTAAADALLIPLTQKGAANGVATLDGASRLTASQVPTTVAPLASPAFTGTPTAPTAAAGDSTTALATTAFATAADALRIPLTQRAAANGVATLDAATRLPVGQLPAVAARTDVAQTFSGAQTFQSLRGQSLQPTAPLGPELAGTAWVFTGTTVASGNGGAFSAGGGTMSQTLAGIVSGAQYEVTWTQAGATSGSRNVQIDTAEQDGGIAPFFYPNSARIVANASGSLSLTFTGDATYNGTITNVSVKQITGNSMPVASYVDAAGTVRGEMRADSLSNMFVGQSAGLNNTTGNSNAFVGRDAGRSNTTGFSNVFVGLAAGFSNTTGFNNSFLGVNAGRSNTTGGSNTFVGRDAGFSNTTGINNSFVGVNAGYSNTTGSNNSFLGLSAGYSNTTGYSNAFVGLNAGYSNTTGYNNAFLGRDAGYSNTTGYNNSFLGREAGRNNTTGSNNSFLGLSAGYAPNGNTANATTTANQQTFLGYQSGQASATQVDNVLALGYRATVGAAGVVAIGTDNTGAGATTSITNAIVLGTVNHKVQLRNNTTGAGSAALGANCPAVTPGAPFTWIAMLSNDGSTVYVPAWK